MKINKITMQENTIKRVVLPAASTLGILAGSSMSGGFPPRNVGEPVNDTLMHKLQYTWDLITGKRDGSGTYTQDIKESTVEKIQDSAEEHSDTILDSVLDFLDDIL